jgi:protease-4
LSAYITNANFDLYSLASVADHIYMSDTGSISMEGYAVGVGFVKGLLDKLGVGVRELRYLDYKTAAESYTRTDMSEANRVQYGAYLDDIYSTTCSSITSSRPSLQGTLDKAINQGFLYSPHEAKFACLVDEVGFPADDTRQWFFYGASPQALTDGALGEYSPRARAGGRTPVIAIVNASGGTEMDSGMKAGTVAAAITDLDARPNVKAIIVRMDSPGGSVDPADLVADAIKRCEKPVVVSMLDTAASGGYWASVYADHIMATPYTLTGSIGVIGTWYYDNGLNDKLGLTLDTLTRGAHADLLTGIIFPHRDLTAEEEARYRVNILALYDVFLSRVADGRGMTIHDVFGLAQGRVYSGLDAVDNGLVDSLGGLSDAMAVAKDLAGLPPDAKVVYKEYPERTFYEEMLEGLLSAELRAELQTAAQSNGQGRAVLPLDLRFGGVR